MRSLRNAQLVLNGALVLSRVCPWCCSCIHVHANESDQLACSDRALRCVR